MSIKVSLKRIVFILITRDVLFNIQQKLEPVMKNLWFGDPDIRLKNKEKNI